jgi:hypothetical protein
MAMRPASPAPGEIAQEEFEIGSEQLLVVYQPVDVGAELDPSAIFGTIAADAAQRAESGMRMRSITSMSLRHAGTAWGNDGSGYETKGAVAVLYERDRPTSG